MTNRISARTRERSTSPRFAIIGAGFAGMTAAIRLARAGADVSVFERADGVGGVWRANTYPGAACDVPSFLYSWSFAPNPRWSRRFAAQREILEYMEDTVDRFGIRDRIHTRREVTSATWSDTSGEWTLGFADGSDFAADFVIAALGQMSEPAKPRLPGIETFSGDHFHTAEWRHDVPVRDRDVVVVGVGASALQVVPAIADVARSVTVLQRSPGYVLEKEDLEYSSPQSVLTSRLRRYSSYVSKEMKTPGMVRWPGLLAPAESAYRVALRDRVTDGELLRKVEPDDRYGCKRILVSNEWFPALQRDSVNLSIAAVTDVVGETVVLSDGSEVHADVIVYGTGFLPNTFMHGIHVRGVSGRSLDDVWQGTPRAYLGMTLPSMPNFFIMYGPNTNPAWNSVLVMLESQVNYLLDVARRWRRRGPFSMEVRPSTFERFSRQVDRRSARSVWVTGCSNWFTTQNGTNTQNWPALVSEYWWRTRWVRWSDYSLRIGRKRASRTLS